MARRRKEDDEEFDEGNDGALDDFDMSIDRKAAVSTENILREGLPVLANEIRKLRHISEKQLLKSSGVIMLCHCLKTASDIRKAHPKLNLNPLSDEELDTMSSEELAILVIDAAKRIGYDASDSELVRVLRKENNENQG